MSTRFINIFISATKKGSQATTLIWFVFILWIYRLIYLSGIEREPTRQTMLALIDADFIHHDPPWTILFGNSFNLFGLNYIVTFQILNCNIFCWNFDFFQFFHRLINRNSFNPGTDLAFFDFANSISL